MKTLMILMILIFCNSIYANSISCKNHPIYCSIIKLRPNINKDFAMQFSNAIYKYSRKYNMDPYRSLAIAMQESSVQNINRKEKFIIFYENCNDEGVCIDDYKIIEGSSDIGIYQFSVPTIIHYDIDAIKVRKDIFYAVSWHFKILKNKQRLCDYLKNQSWSCYHSMTEKYRKKYMKDVNKYYDLIKEVYYNK